MQQATLSSVTADTVLQTAIQMEELGRDFYEALGAVTDDPAMADLCRRLAAAESSHLDVFRQMRSKLARRGETVLLRDRRLAEARQAAKDAILPDPDTIRRLARSGGAADVIEMAVRMETEAVAFYRVLAGQLPDAAAVEAVIREEEGHLRLLTTFRADQA